MWSSSRNDHLKKGFVLPLTLILLTFGSIMVFVAGIQVTRTTDEIQSYNIISSQQNIAANVIEAASYHYFQNPSASFDTTWDGIDTFKNHVSNRGGVEGTYWSNILSELNSGTNCINLTGEIESYETLSGFGEGNYDISAYVYPIGEKRIVIGVSDRKGRRRYSIGLLSNIARPSMALPAVRLAYLDRVLTKMHSLKGNKVEGDLIYGEAVLLDDVSIFLTDSSTPGEIINPNLQAFSVDLKQEILDQYPDWFSATSTTNIDLIFDSWKNDHLESLPDASTTVYINDSSTWPDTYDENTLFVIDATPSSVDGYYLDFDESGLNISYDGNTVDIPASEALSSKIHVQINGDVTIGNDPHKISKVTGKYSLTVYGDIVINTNLVYNDIYEYVNNGKGESKVSNHPLEIEKDLITQMMNDNINDDLDLVSIGGDAVMKYKHGSSTHGVKFLSGDIMAFKENGVGGDISYPDLKEVIHGNQTSQYFVFGSITANTFDSDGDASGYLSSLILVANSQSENGSGSTTSELQLIGMRTW
ncbi:MAG: hypothetical protein R6U52_01320 [Kosmotogaceae bacterium]